MKERPNIKFHLSRKQKEYLRGIVLCVAMVICLSPWLAKGASMGIMGMMNSSGEWLGDGAVVTDEVVQVHFGQENCYYKVYNSDDRLMERDFEDVSGIKVLQIYPSGAEHLTEWFAPLNVWRARLRNSIPLLGNVYHVNSVGAITSQTRSATGIFDIYCVTIDEFNQFPTGILKQDGTCRNGWNYDVVCFGFNDGNMVEDDRASVLTTYANGVTGRVKSKFLSPSGADAMKTYLQAGGGTVFGHDTIVNGYVQWGSYWADAPETGTAYNLQVTPDANHFMELASYCGIVLNNEQPTLSTRINKNREGLLTKYPFPMTTDDPNNDPNSRLDYIDLSLTPTHSLGQTSVGSTIWYTLDGTGTPYLQTYLNTAVTQAGHTNHAYNSEKERKLLANTIFYVNQFLFSGDWIEVEDLNAPNAPTIGLDNTTKLCSFDTEDNGTIYGLTGYMWDKNNVSNMRDVGTADYVSNTVSVNSKTGVAGYYYLIDQSANTVITNETGIPAGAPVDVSAYLNSNTPYYIHAVAIDKNGNCSETAHMEIARFNPTHTIQFMYDESTQQIDKVLSTEMPLNTAFYMDAPTKTGYTLQGFKVIRQSDNCVLNSDGNWTSHSTTDASQYQIYTGGSCVTLTSDWCNSSVMTGETFTFVGVWEPIMFTVKYMPDEVTQTIMASESVAFGTEFTTHSASKAGYQLVGWKVIRQSDNMVRLNDGTWVPHDNSVNVLQMMMHLPNTKQSITLDWLALGNAGTDTYVFVAIWGTIENGYYTVAFDKNSPDAQGETLHQVIPYNIETALNVNRYTRTGYEFVEWNTLLDGTGTSYMGGQKVVNLATPSSGTTVFNGTDFSTVYNYDYYINKYPDIAAAFAGNPEGAISHFVNGGMNEGRQGCEGFDVNFYKSTYSDIEAMYGNDLRLYYIHYMETGVHEQRWGNANHGSVILYAQWTPADDTPYRVQHWLQNLDGDAAIKDDVNYTLKETETCKGTTNASVTPPVKSYTGFIAPSAQTVSIKADGSLVVNYYYTRNSYTVALEKGTGIDSVTGAGTYLYGSRVTINAAVSDGYAWSNWTGTLGTVSTKQYTFTMPAKDMTYKANAVAGEGTPYKVNYWLQNLDGDASIKDDVNYTLKETEELTGKTNDSVTPSVKNYTGFTAPSAQTVSIKADGSLVVNYYYTRNSYTVALEKGTGIDTVAGDGMYLYEESVTIDTTVLNGYTWSNWTEAGLQVAATQKYVFTMPASDVTYKANATPNSYTIVYDGNGATSGDTASSTHVYNVEATLTENGYVKADHIFKNWNTLPDGTGTSYSNKAVVKNLTDINNDIVTLYAQWEEVVEDTIFYTVKFDANGGVGTMSDITLTVNVPANLPLNTFTKANEYGDSKFLGWNLDATATGALYQDEAEVMDLSEIAGDIITLYAIWDDCPWIEARDLYFSLQEAQSGAITYDLLMSFATAEDREDGSAILPGIDAERGTSFTIIDYLPTDFTQFRQEGSVTETYKVVDSAGNEYQKMITVYLVDTTPIPVKPRGTTRFINEKYYNESYENGGLEDNSLWKTDPEYVALIQRAFENSRNNTPEISFFFTHETILEMKEFIRENGYGKSKHEDALQRFYEQFMAPNVVN